MGSSKRPSWNPLLMMHCRRSAARTNNRGDKGSPCLTSRLQWKWLPGTPFNRIEEDLEARTLWVQSIHLSVGSDSIKRTECSIQKISNLKILALGMDQFEFCRGCVLRLAWPLEGEEYLGRHWSSLLKWKPNLFALGVVHFGCVWFEEWREPSSSHSSLFYLVCGMAWVDLSRSITTSFPTS